MSDRDLQSLLRKTIDAGFTWRSVKGVLDDELEKRYGVAYNDLPNDAGDPIVEMIEYTDGQPVSLKAIDKIMADAGYPARSKQ